MQNVLVGQAIANLIQKQPSIIRRKDTVLLIATGFTWFLVAMAPLLVDVPAWGLAIIGVLATIAASLTTAFTKGAVTPSVQDRVVDELQRIEWQAQDRVVMPDLKEIEDTVNRVGGSIAEHYRP